MQNKLAFHASHCGVCFCLQKFGILEHADDPTTSMIFYTSLISLCQVAVRLESQLSLLSAVTNAPPNDDSTGNSSSAESDIASNENETISSAVDDGSGHKHLQMQALCAVVGQVITDACNYVSIYHCPFSILVYR